MAREAERIIAMDAYDSLTSDKGAIRQWHREPEIVGGILKTREIPRFSIKIEIFSLNLKE